MRAEGRVLAVVAAGGALGSVARYGLGLAVPGPPGTLVINVTGCLLIGLLTARHADDVLVRAFLGTGVLGGFTTFSTASTDTLALLTAGAYGPAAAYAAGTLLLAIAATAAGLHLGRPPQRSVR